MTSEPQTLFGPVAADLATVEARLRAEIEGDPEEVGAPMLDLFEAGGKRIRPALVLLAAACGRYDPEVVMPAAMAVEIIHAATLVHDDVIDRSAMRRGRPTVAARLGDEPAIVVGDFYFAKAYELAARTEAPEVVALLAQAVMEICAGEVRQQELRFRYSDGVAGYMAWIKAKTATLLAACCEIGAVLAGLNDQRREALRAYGELMGVGFQIADDVLDYTGSEDEVGKPIGHDVAEGFATLPLLIAMEGGEGASELRSLLRDGHRLGEAEAQSIVELVRASGAPEHAIAIAHDYTAQATRRLESLEPGAPREALATLADYVVSRKL